MVVRVADELVGESQFVGSLGEIEVRILRV